MTPGRVHFWSIGYNLSKLGRGILGYVIYQISRLLALWFQAKIRNQYNQVPHLTQNILWESDKSTIKHHKQEPRGQANVKHVTPGAGFIFGPRA